MNCLAMLQHCFPHRSPVDERSVSGTQIPDHHRVFSHIDLTMRRRNRGVGNLKIVGKTAADKIRARLELDFPSGRRTRINHQPCHELSTVCQRQHCDRFWLDRLSKSERRSKIRSPKSEEKDKPWAQNYGIAGCTLFPDSEFGFLSDFGLRVSGFLQCFSR